MTSPQKPPSANASLAELHAWAARGARATATSLSTHARADRSGARAAGALSEFSSDAVPARVQETAGSRMRGSVLPKVVLALGLGVVAYVAFSFVIGILMTVLAVVGGIAAVYAAYRIGHWQGRRSR